MHAPDVERFLQNLNPTLIRPGLERIRHLLKALDHPEAGLKTVLIAGTNGKGSVAACLTGILAAAGARVATYTSPHLRRFSERIKFEGKEIADEALVHHFSRVRNAMESAGEVTYFEFVTALALDYFSSANPDWTVLEVGLGGRWDAVNAVEPQLCMITPIGLDHTHLLGTTITAVAKEKASIIRHQRPVVCGRQTQAALRVIETHCRERLAPLSLLGRAFRLRQSGVADKGQVFSYMEAGMTLKDIALPLLGAYQCDNAACAVRAYRQLCEEGSIAWSEEAVRKGLAEVRLEGRYQILSQNPLVVADGAHNELAVRSLMEAVRSLSPHRPLTVVFGVLEDKDYLRMAKVIFPLASRVVIVPVLSFPERSADPQAVAARTASLTRELFVAPDLSTALKTTLAEMPDDGLCLITGSMYLTGEAISLFESSTFSW
jgi:dihydrofolate synthase/folylpolyglutamate synthase